MFLRANQQTMPIQKPVLHNSHSIYVCIVISLFLLSACSRQNGGAGGPGSPLKVRASITPEPMVGQAATWHIEIFSTGPEYQDTTLIVELPKSVELVSGDSDWQGTVPADGTVAVDLVIRVMTPGEWKISAAASSIIGPGSNAAGWKTLYITSSETSAEVVEDIDWVGTPVPALQFAPSNIPEATPTSSP